MPRLSGQWLGQDFKPLSGLGAVDFEVRTVRGEDVAKSRLLRGPYHRCVGQIHRSVCVLQLASAIRAPASTSSAGLAICLGPGVALAVGRKVGRANMSSDKSGTARGIERAGLEAR